MARDKNQGRCQPGRRAVLEENNVRLTANILPFAGPFLKLKTRWSVTLSSSISITYGAENANMEALKTIQT
jgi:hypothetical protein